MSLCLGALRERADATISDLADATGLSRPTVTLALEELEARGLVSQDTSKAAAGRPAKSFALAHTGKLVVGIDLSLSTIRIVVADQRGHSIGRETAVVHSPKTDAPSLEPLSVLLVQTLAAIGKTLSDVAAIGVAVAGLIDERGVLTSAPQVSGWSGLDLPKLFSEEFGVPVVVDNDLSLAADAESRFGALAGAETGIYALTWHHVSARVTAGGEVIRGRRGLAGEVGLLRSFRDAATPKGPLVDVVPHVAAKLERLREDAADQDGLAALSGLTAAMVPAITALILTMDPDIIVLGGELGHFADLIADPLNEAISEFVTGIDTTRQAIQAGMLGTDASAIGALSFAFERFSERVYGLPGIPAPTTISLPMEAPSGSTTAPLSAFRAAVVGVGARAPLALHVKQAGGTIVAAVDPAPQMAERAQQLFGDVDVFATVADLVASGIPVDGAFVTSPDFTHAAVAVELLEAGIPVYIEKPMAITIEEADSILETAYRTGTKVYVGHNMRHMQVVRMMKDIIDRGEIGEVKAIWTRHFVGHGGDYYFKDWHAERAKGTSLLLQKGAHDIDVMHWLAGSPSRTVVGIGDLAIYGDVGSRRDNSDRRMGDWFSMKNWPPTEQTDLNPVIDVEDISMILMTAENGVLMSYQQCHFTPDYWRNYTVIGTKGRIENFDDGIGGEIRLWNERCDYLERGHARYPITGSEDDHGGADPLTVAEFVEFVRRGTPTDTSPVAAREAVAAGVAGAASIRSGSSAQHIPPLREELLDYFGQYQAQRVEA
ncbi:MAG: ROK family protein [Actinomycetales bacterium]|nr:ROK family protein [Leifsonia sp.]